MRADGTNPLKIVVEDVAHSSGDTGILAMVVRADSAACPAGSDGDNAPLIVDANGKLWVNSQVTGLVPGTTASSLGKAEDAAHTSGDVGVMALSVRQNAAAALGGTDADYQPLITDASGMLWVNAGAVGTITPGTAASSLGKAEDAGHSSGDVGVMALAVRQDTAAALGGTDADYLPLITDATGRLWVHCSAIEPGSAATSLGKLEDAAHSSGDLGVMALSVRKNTAAATSGSDSDYQPLITDTSGQLWVHVGAIEAGSALIGGVTNAGPSWTSIYGVSAAPVTSADMSSAAAAVTDAPTSTEYIVVDQITVSVGTTMLVTFTCETSGAILLKLYMLANSTQTVPFTNKLKLATADKKLMAQASGSGNISVMVGYHSEA